MNTALKTFLKNLGYGVAGLVVTSFITFLHQNPLEFGVSTGLVIVALTTVEEYFFPTQTVASARAQIAAAKAL